MIVERWPERRPTTSRARPSSIRRPRSSRPPAPTPPGSGFLLSKDPTSDRPPVGRSRPIRDRNRLFSLEPAQLGRGVAMGDTVFWSPMIQKPGEVYIRSHIMMMRQKNGRWSAPVSAPFTRAALGCRVLLPERPPGVFPVAGNASERAGVGSRKDRYSDRTGDGWAPPRLVDAAVNDVPQHWQFSVDSRHTIYFFRPSSRRPRLGRPLRRTDARWEMECAGRTRSAGQLTG